MTFTDSNMSVPGQNMIFKYWILFLGPSIYFVVRQWRIIRKPLETSSNQPRINRKNWKKKYILIENSETCRKPPWPVTGDFQQVSGWMMDQTYYKVQCLSVCQQHCTLTSPLVFKLPRPRLSYDLAEVIKLIENIANMGLDSDSRPRPLGCLESKIVHWVRIW